MKGVAVIFAVVAVLVYGHVAEAQDTSCQPLRCLVPCPRGYKRDANNCLTCECLTEQEIKANLIPLLAGKIRY